MTDEGNAVNNSSKRSFITNTYRVSLSGVLHHLVVDKADNVWSDGGLEDGRQVKPGPFNHLVLGIVHGNDGTRCHCDDLVQY